jgi:hypothetical protein
MSIFEASRLLEAPHKLFGSKLPDFSIKLIPFREIAAQ